MQCILDKKPIVFIGLLILVANSGCLDFISKDDEDRTALWNTGLNKYCIDHDNKERCWLILVPEVIISTEKAPLIIDMHGIGGSMYLQHNLTRFANISEEYGVYVAYPQGFDNEWNMADDICCGDDDDFNFILEI